jgi:glycosyltransferase involved in cell wall biosynthesis
MARQFRRVGRVAIIETYPYEAVWGGDAVYLDAIRCYLTERGHTVDTYVTDLTRGRSNPTVTLKTRACRNHRWHVRNAISLGPNRFCSLDVRMVGKAMRRLPGRRAPKDDGIEEAEAEWVLAGLRDSRPDIAILAFAACGLAERIAATGVKVLALKGFFSNRRIRLGEVMPTPFVAPDVLESLAHATMAGFNNQHDLDLYEQLSARKNGVLVGMGFQPQFQPAAHDRPPALLYVAARTNPNIESLDWFLERVWPLVHSAEPEIELRVAGSVAGAFAGRLAERVRFLGFVDSLAEEYRGSWSVVAPFVNGSSGVKTKIAEALSYGRPVVTTSIGVDLEQPDQFGGAVTVADDPTSFAATLLEILRNDEARRERHAQAAEKFDRHFASDAAYSAILRLLEQSEDAARQALAT